MRSMSEKMSVWMGRQMAGQMSKWVDSLMDGWTAGSVGEEREGSQAQGENE